MQILKLGKQVMSGRVCLYSKSLGFLQTTPKKRLNLSKVPLRRFLKELEGRFYEQVHLNRPHWNRAGKTCSFPYLYNRLKVNGR